MTSLQRRLIYHTPGNRFKAAPSAVLVARCAVRALSSVERRAKRLVTRRGAIAMPLKWHQMVKRKRRKVNESRIATLWIAKKVLYNLSTYCPTRASPPP